MMMTKVICFTLLFMFISLSRSQICQSRTLRNETKDVCCADYEKIENDCVACLEGYTSDMGQNCKPCPKNNYGEKCGYECSCLDFEVCDNVEGCVQALSTTDSSMYVTSVTFIQRVSDKKCIVNTESGEIKKVCCADFEEKGNVCKACLKGFTSNIGQKCRPCSNHSYGEKCGFDCSCTDNEMCDHVEGCVPSPSTSGHSVYSTSDDKSLTWMTTTATNSGKDNTTWNIVSQTNGQNTDDKNGEKLSSEIIAYYTLSLVLGIGLCFILYKYRILGKIKKATIIQSQNLSLPENRQDIKTEERLYDTIGDTNMLRYVQQMLNLTSSVSGESKIVESRENTSFFDEGHQETKQLSDQPVIRFSPPITKDCVTEHRRDGTL